MYTNLYMYVQYRLQDSYHFPITSGHQDSGSGQDNSGIPMCDQHLLSGRPETLIGIYEEKVRVAHTVSHNVAP